MISSFMSHLDLVPDRILRIRLAFAIGVGLSLELNFVSLLNNLA